jgi:hypothetical protein
MEMKDAGSPRAGRPEMQKSITSNPVFRLVGVVIAAALLIALVIISLGLGQSRETQQVKLIEVVGLVEFASGDSAGDWQLVSNGHNIKEGQRIRTGADGSVVLLFYEGSRTTLGPGTDLVLTTLTGDGKLELSVDLDQRTGETFHSVVPLQGKESAFQVHTSAGIASVHGTTFRVSVPQEGAARFSVDEGQVLVTSNNQEMMLSAGQVTTVLADEPLEDPAFQFSLKGTLTEISGDTWTVDGVPFQVTSDTNLKDDPQVNSFVLVDGHILDGTWIADMVKVMKDKKPKASFTGNVDSIGTSWVISGISVLVDGDTEIDDGIDLGDPVEVKFIVLENDGWLALEIELLVDDEEPTDPTATSTATSTFTPTPILTNTPTVTLTITPTATVTATAIVTDCVGVDPHPKGQTLADTYGVNYEEIMGWFCQGFGFGEIDHAYSLSEETGIPVEDIFDMRTSGMGWGEIKKTLQPSKTPKPSKIPKAIKTQKPSKTPKPTKTPKN